MILVTGGLGFIGSHTARALSDAGEEVLATRHRASEPASFLRDRSAVVVETLDVGDAASWRAIEERHAISGIIHLASGTIDSGPLAAVDAAAAGMRHAIDAATRWGVRLTVASTIGVYAGTPVAGLLREDAGLNLEVPFGIPASKKVVEVLAAVARAERNLDIVAVRLPAVYGPLGNPASRFFALPEIVHATAAGRPAELPLTMYADDAIDTCFVTDVARAIAEVQLADRLASTVYNVGSGAATSNADVLDAVRRLRPGTPTPSGFLPGASTAPSGFDVTRLTRDVGFSPRVDLEEGLTRYLDWLEAGNPR